tara:strand:- start:26 stop:919 length:894 start_codon:yes stop_codon:yes gene_type:complete
MYFSKKNKNYMFEILSNVIQEETGIQIIHSQKYIDLYRLHYSNIFNSVNTDELSILNKEIINQIGNLILKDINSPKIQNGSPKINKLKEPIQIKIDTKQNISIHSTQRKFDSLNRFNFSVNTSFIEFIPQKITLMKEQNSLFSNPNINVLFNNQDNLLFTLKDTKKLGELEYYTYECLTEDKIQCNDSLKIQIKNYLMNDPSDKPDKYQILKIKQITIENKDYLCFEINNHEINIGDELGLFIQNDTIQIETSVFVKKIIKNYLLVNCIDIDMSKDYYCLQMNKNITIQGLSSSPSG